MLVRGTAISLLLGGVLLVSGAAAPAQTAALRGDCQARFQEYLKRGNPGYFFYAEDPASTKANCGWSTEDPAEFDRYPSSAQIAFTACQNLVDERGIKARCEMIAHGSTLVAGSYREAQARQDAAGLVRDGMRCGQTPLGRWFWTERAFCDMPWHGPARASGVVIWNHGIHGTVVQHAAPVPPVFRLLQARGWDVVKIARNNLGETSGEQSLYRAVQRTLEEVTARQREGYARIVLAGQSFGGYITLEAAGSARGIHGVVAMAPGVRPGGAGNLDAAVINQAIARLAVDRITLVFPRNDTLFGSQERGSGAAKALSSRKGSFLILDETYDILDHGGGTNGKFAVKYGPCLVDYLTRSEAGTGAVRCQPSAVEQQAIARELLPKLPDSVTIAPPGDGVASGPWFGVLEPSGELVSFAIVETGGSRRAMFSLVSGWRRGGLYELSTGEKGLTVRLRTATLVVTKDATLTFTTTAGRSPYTATLAPLPREP
jgi:pimeloyl-ACP methyl ester carboxylesterase